MKQFLEYENYSYAKYLLVLIKLCNKYKIPYQKIGDIFCDNPGISYPVYRLVINPLASRDFCIVAGAHGYEVAGPFTILELIKNKDRYLSTEICYFIYPVFCPYSFDLRQRNNYLNRDVNGLTSQVLQSPNFPEVKIFYSDIKDKKLNVFLDLHEDVDETRFYTYVFEKTAQEVYRKIIESASKNFQIWKTGRIYGDKTDNNGLIINKHDRSLEDRLYTSGQAQISLCTETPGKLPLEQRILLNLQNIKILSKDLLKK